MTVPWYEGRPLQWFPTCVPRYCPLDKCPPENSPTATVKAAELDSRIAAAEAALNAVDKREALKEADPQSASMAKAIVTDQTIIAALSQAFFAIAIEFGSGVGFWLVFGHAAPVRKQEVHAPSTELVPIDQGPQKLYEIDQKPGDIVERFFLEAVRPALNRRVQSLAMLAAFKKWCADRSLDLVMSHAMFGRLARWRKDRIGGTVWYLDCELAKGDASLSPARTHKALPRLGTMAKAAQTTY